MKTINKIIIAAIILLGLACCSEKAPKLIKTEEFVDRWDNKLMIRATYEDSTVVIFALRDDKPQEVMVSSIEQLGPEGIVIIPKKITSNKVTYNVTLIDEEAFDGSDLVNVTIPNTITDIADGAFEGCERLVNINIPNSVTSIGEEAFYGCERLTSITIPNSVTNIGKRAFEECKGLKSISIPDGVKQIGDQAFVNCTNLESITIPASVTELGYQLFGRCAALTTIEVMDGNEKYDSRDGCNAIIETATNTMLAACSNTIIPNSVTTILYAFSGCSNLKSISIPNGVTEIGEHAFSYCESLSSIAISNSVTRIGRYAFRGCSGLTSVSIPNSVTIIEENAFYDCTGLTSVDIPESVANITGFAGCMGLTSVTIPNSVTSIGAGAFSETGLTSITIPNRVKSIGRWAFANCKSLTSVTIPNSVISISNGAFEGCDNLTSVIIQNPDLSYDFEEVFKWCEKLNRWDVVFQLDASNVADGLTKEYEWIVGTWACDMGPYGNVVVKFDGDGSSGTCTEAQYGSYKTGTYYVSGNTLCYKLNGESVTTTIEIESGHRLAAGGGCYYHKRDNGDEQRNEANNNGKPHVPNDATKGFFSVGYSQQVSFAKGNLQYQASSGTWRFANNQWETMGQGNVNISANYSGWIDLFGWGTGNGPLNHSENNNDYSTFCDWGSYGMGDG